VLSHSNEWLTVFVDYIPVTTRVGNQLYRFAGILAHNLTCEFMQQSGISKDTASLSCLSCLPSGLISGIPPANYRPCRSHDRLSIREYYVVLTITLVFRIFQDLPRHGVGHARAVTQVKSDFQSMGASTDSVSC
jgi:hypothetical protein